MKQASQVRRRELESSIARGVGQYIGLMVSVQALDQAIAYLQKQREEILAVLSKPLSVPGGSNNTSKIKKVESPPPSVHREGDSLSPCRPETK